MDYPIMDNPLGKNQGWQADKVLPFSFLMYLITE